jgi:hypothetical protein
MLKYGDVKLHHVPGNADPPSFFYGVTRRLKFEIRFATGRRGG